MTVIPSPALTGVVLSVCGTFAWAGHYLFVRLGTESGRVTNAVIVSMVCNLVLFVPVAFLLNYPHFGLTWRATATFALAGLGSGLFGRLFQYMSTERIGASRTSPVVASAGLVSTLLAVFVLGESLSPSHLVGIALIVAGVAATTDEATRSSSGSRSLGDVGPSMVLPLLTAFLYGVEPVLIKIGLAEGTPYLVGMAIMIVAAFVGFLGYRLLFGTVPVRSVLDDAGLKWYVGAGVTGGVAFVTYFAALHVAPVVVVVPIFNATPMLVVAFSAVLMPRHLERVTWRTAGGAATVVCGAVLVTLSA